MPIKQVSNDNFNAATEDITSAVLTSQSKEKYKSFFVMGLSWGGDVVLETLDPWRLRRPLGIDTGFCSQLWSDADDGDDGVLDESSKEPFLHTRDGKLGEFGRGFIV